MDKPAPPHKDADLVGPEADPYSEYYNVDMMEGRAGPRDPRPSTYERAPDLVVKVVIEPTDLGLARVYLAEQPDHPSYFVREEARDYAIVMALQRVAGQVARKECPTGTSSFNVRVDIDRKKE